MAQLTEWLIAARAGSRQALGELLNSYRNYLHLVAVQKLGLDLQPKVGASDLVQDTFVDAQKDFAEFQGTTSAEFANWLERMLVHNIVDCVRQFRETEKRQINREVSLDQVGADGQPVIDVEQASTPSGHAVAREEEVRLERELSRLPDDYRQAIVLRNHGGRSFEEIGNLLNRSPDAARKLWGRAVLRLRKELEQA